MKIAWSPDFAYAVGLLASDGCMYKDGRHLNLTTKDKEQAENFVNCLKLRVKIGLKSSGSSRDKKYFHIQFGDTLFYQFLLGVGLTPAKSKTIGKLKIPSNFFFHFLRGVFDGDGSSYSYWDPRWRSSFMFYMTFSSASLPFLTWLQYEIRKRLKIKGHITNSGGAKKENKCHQLKYAKRESIPLIKEIYGDGGKYLARKQLKIRDTLAIVGLSLV